MILAAAACAAAGISYIFNDDEQSINTKYETVTVSSTIIDKQGIVKYVIHPRIVNPYSFLYHPLINQEEKSTVLVINKETTNQFKLPIENNFKQEFSIVFYWSIPLKARLLQLSTKPCLMIENLNNFERHSMKISIGTQNEINKNSDSEIALSNSDECSYQTNQEKTTSIFNNKESDDTLDSLMYDPINNNHITPIGILKKKKLDLNERENNQKKFCFNKIFDSNEEKITRNMIFKNVNLCVENLSKILSESCSNTEEQLTTLQNSSSLISTMNNNKKNTQDIYKNIHSKLFQHEEGLSTDPLDLNNERTDIDLLERLSDGIILHRGQQFGLALGEPMIRKYHEDENLLINSSHSINELHRLLSKTNCLLMRQYQIESIEDLIRLFLEQGQHHFTELMINLFKVDRLIVEQLNRILIEWAKTLT